MCELKKIKLIICLIILGCTIEDNFPDIYVNETIPITMPEYSNVYNTPLGYQYIDGGLGGIIIVHGLNNDYIAYDRACTNEVNSDCIVSGESGSENDPVLKCIDCCNSRFIINDGSVTQESTANQALKRYNTYFDGVMLYITN